MLIITTKTPRAMLIAEIEHLRELHTKALGESAHRILELEAQRDIARSRAAQAERKVEILETDRDNLLGTIRVMADSGRWVRIRRSTVRDADMALALPSHNTDEG